MNLLSGLGLLITVFVLVAFGIVLSAFAGLLSLLALSFTGSILLGGLVFLAVGVLGILKMIF